jgi:hypothetical protein
MIPNETGNAFAPKPTLASPPITPNSRSQRLHDLPSSSNTSTRRRSPNCGTFASVEISTTHWRRGGSALGLHAAAMAKRSDLRQQVARKNITADRPNRHIENRAFLSVAP